jgi:hypothetical protein
MGRSVNYKYGGIVVFIDTSDFEHDEDWTDFVDNLCADISALFPSMENADKWPERELHTILENTFAGVCVSEYCGLASVSLFVRDDNESTLAANWVNLAGRTFKKKLHKIYGKNALIKQGTFSNGEGVYCRVGS